MQEIPLHLLQAVRKEVGADNLPQSQWPRALDVLEERKRKEVTALLKIARMKLCHSPDEQHFAALEEAQLERRRISALLQTP